MLLSIDDILGRVLEHYPEYYHIQGPHKNTSGIYSVRLSIKGKSRKFSRQINVIRLAYELHHKVCLLPTTKLKLDKYLRTHYSKMKRSDFKIDPNKIDVAFAKEGCIENYQKHLSLFQIHVTKIYPDCVSIYGPYDTFGRKPFFILKDRRGNKFKYVKLANIYYEYYHNICLLPKQEIIFIDGDDTNYTKENLYHRNGFDYIPTRQHNDIIGHNFQGIPSFSEVGKRIFNHYDDVIKVRGPYINNGILYYHILYANKRNETHSVLKAYYEYYYDVCVLKKYMVYRKNGDVGDYRRENLILADRRERYRDI